MASASPPPAASAAARGHRPIVRRLLHLTRTLHTYVTMLGLILLIFFSFTGFVLNNGGLYRDSGKLFNITDTSTTERTASLPRDILSGQEHLFAIEHYLRDHAGARGELSATPDEDDATVRFQFAGPGRKVDYEITKATGETKIDEQRNMFASITDLHTGEHAGPVWNYFIDATAIFLFFAALSGLILWISLPKRRALGLIALGVSIAGCVGVYLWLVP